MSDELSIGVVGGTGSEGRGLALRFALAGAHVTVGSRDASRAVETAARLRHAHPMADINGASNHEAISRSGVVILAIPFVHVESTIAAEFGAFRPGTLVLDVTVPVVFEGGRPRFIEPADGSAGEHVRRLVPEHVVVACAFKTLPAALLEQVAVPLDCDDLVCGDSKAARDRAMAIVGRIPTLRPVDAGALDAARILERMTLLAITLNRRYKGHGARFRVVGLGT
jgi:NADPH-dependent F420 reductase